MSAPSAVMCVGKKFYKLHEYVFEAKNYGVSKRVSKSAIPEGLVVGESKIFLAHPEAIVKVTAEGTTLTQLWLDLIGMGKIEEQRAYEILASSDPYWEDDTLEPYDYVPDVMLTLALIISKLTPEEYRLLDDTYKFAFCMGIFGYAFFQGFQYVAKPGEEDLPEELAHLAGYVEPVHVVYKGREYDE